MNLEQVRGIEPPYSAWEADVLPMNYTCIACIIAGPSQKINPFFLLSLRADSDCLFPLLIL